MSVVAAADFILGYHDPAADIHKLVGRRPLFSTSSQFTLAYLMLGITGYIGQTLLKLK